MPILSQVCSLCQSPKLSQYHEDSYRSYLLCQTCGLVFVPPDQRLSREAEKAEYDKHENDIYDFGYRNFLSRLFKPMLDYIRPDGVGLDFGCGPAPALVALFREQGYKMAQYDPFYFPQKEVLKKESYNFITATEVFEHLHHPHRELDLISHCLQPGGFLGLMTKMVISPSRFAGWHYIRDLTHVCFFSKPTFGFVAERWGLQIVLLEKDVIIFQKPV